MRQKRLTWMALDIAGLLFLTTIGVRYVMGSWMPFMFIPLGLSFIILGFLFYYYRQTTMSFFRHRNTKNSLSTSVQFLILIAGLVLANYLVVKNPLVMDLTRSRILGLSPQSVELIEKVRSHFDVLVLHRGDRDKLKVNSLKRLFSLAKQKSAMAGEFRLFNMYTDVTVVQEIIESSKQRSVNNVLAYISCNGERHEISHPHSEVEFAQAINGCFSRQSKRLGLVINHGEWRATNSGELVFLSQQMQGLKIETIEVSLLQQQSLEGIEALLIAGPRTPFLKAELDLLEQFLDGGGKLIVALDPDKKTNLGELLNKYSLAITGNYILKIKGNQGDTFLATSQFNSQNSIVKSLTGGTLLFELATSLTETPGEKSWSVDHLVYSGEQSFAVEKIQNMNFEPEFKSHVVATTSSGSAGGQIVLVGDSDWLTDSYLPVFYNKNFLISVLSNLFGDQSLTVIPSKQVQNEPIFLARMQTAGFFGLSLMFPVLLFLATVIAWVKGRK